MNFNQPTAEMTELLRECGSPYYEVALKAQRRLAQELSLALREDPPNGQAKALTMPIKQGILRGDNLGGIYEVDMLTPGVAAEYPLDFLTPDNVNDFIAFTIPSQGKLPEKHIESTYLMVKTFDVGAALDTYNKFIRDARWPVVRRMFQVLEAMFVRKKNDDGWHVIQSSASSRNITVYDDAATAGLFTKRLVNLMQISMRRNGGGNSTSQGAFELTDLYLSPEGHGDPLSWDSTQIDETNREKIFVSGNLMRIYGVNLHPMTELGVAQSYTNYWTSTLGNSLPGSKVELVLGLCLKDQQSFVNPVRQDLIIQENPEMPLRRRFGLNATWEGGWAALDSRYALAGAF